MRPSIAWSAVNFLHLLAACSHIAAAPLSNWINATAVEFSAQSAPAPAPNQVCHVLQALCLAVSGACIPQLETKRCNAGGCGTGGFRQQLRVRRPEHFSVALSGWSHHERAGTAAQRSSDGRLWELL